MSRGNQNAKRQIVTGRDYKKTMDAWIYGYSELCYYMDVRHTE